MIFEIETDGIISPKEAVSQGLDILAKHLEIIGRELGTPSSSEEINGSEEVTESDETEEKPKKTRKKAKK